MLTPKARVAADPLGRGCDGGTRTTFYHPEPSPSTDHTPDPKEAHEDMHHPGSGLL